MDIKVTKLDEESIEFELIGVSPSYANALRRILISEVPTMAIEHVFFLNNTSTIPVCLNHHITSHRIASQDTTLTHMFILLGRDTCA